MESQLNRTELTRIRVKYDPANDAGESNDYVGYVLEEDGAGGVLAIVPAMGNEPMSLSSGEYELDAPCEDPLTKFKKHVVDNLMTRGYHETVSDKIDDIINAKNVGQLEQLLNDCGCDLSAILNLYRDYVTNE